MIVTYNGVDLQVENIYRWEEHTVYDDSGTDRSLTHYRIGVKAVYNPAATTSSPIPPAAGNMAIQSISDLRDASSTPRRQLFVRIGDQVLLNSPAMIPGQVAGTYFPCDARNGPKPITPINVFSFHGIKSAIVAFEIETYLPTSLPTFSPAPAPILTHRWRMTEDIDDLNYATKTVEGVAVFSQAILQILNLGIQNSIAFGPPLVPDDYRPRLFHPIPDNCQRKNIRVAQSEDGLTINYSFQDDGCRCLGPATPS